MMPTTPNVKLPTPRSSPSSSSTGTNNPDTFDAALPHNAAPPSFEVTTTERPTGDASVSTLGTSFTSTADNIAGSSNTNNIASMVVAPEKPPPFREARDVSGGSRDSLRRHVHQRRNNLTFQEQTFLDQLLVHGNEVEVQLAMTKLQDKDLFFECAEGGSLLSVEQPPQQPHSSTANGDDTRDSVTDLSSVGDQPSMLHGAVEVSLGSTRRLKALERRKSVCSTLWKAHGKGLAVSIGASRKSMIRRDSSTGSLSRSASGIFRNQVPLLPVRSTFVGKTTRGRSQSMVAIPPIPPPQKLYRGSSTSSRKSVSFHTDVTDTGSITSPFYRFGSSKQPLHHHRSASDSIFPHAPPLREEASNSSIPSIPPATAIRSDSISSIPSIHHGHPILSDCSASASTFGGILPSQAMRSASISSSTVPSIHQGQPIGLANSDEMSSILPPSMATRQDSTSSSLLAIRPARPLRQDSTASSVVAGGGRPGPAFIADSTSSLPSLHPGRPIRQESTGSLFSTASIPSIHHAVPIRRNSLASQLSIPSIRHGQPVRSESISSIPSVLLPGRPVMSSNIQTFHSSPGEHSAPIQDAKTKLYPQHASEDIASTWMEQKHAPQQDTNIPGQVTVADSLVEDTPQTVKRILETGDPLTPSPAVGKPLLVRLASANVYQGEGMEVSDWNDPVKMTAWSSMDGISSVRTCNSFDESQTSSYPQRTDIFRNVRRSYSDEDFGNSSFWLLNVPTSSDNQGYYIGDGVDETSWDMTSDAGRYDSWNIIKDEYANGYGGGGTLDFLILGTSADDEAAHPHVLSPPLMESLQGFLPFSKSGENMFLKYSLVRDGASLYTFLQRARGIQHSILAIETVDGEVFGAFTGQAWRKNWNYFGSSESFLWRMRRSRLEKTHGILEQAHLESEIDVFPYTGENRFIQLCTHNRIAVGGGIPTEKKSEDGVDSDGNWGFGLAMSGDLLSGTSNPCVTFSSPSLSKVHADGGLFEIVNIELWTLTPCRSVAEAEKLDCAKLFLATNE